MPVRHLANAPIREALIDIQVNLPPDFSAVVFRDLRDTVGPNYPRVVESTKQETTIEFNAGTLAAATSNESGLHAVQFISERGESVAQFRIDGFTFNKLRPYTDWASIFPEAMRLWAIYSSSAKPANIARVAVRYINEFSVPSGLTRLSPYMRLVPQVPSGAPGKPKSALSRVVTEDAGSGLASIVTYSMTEKADSKVSDVILDIDVLCTHVRGTSTKDIEPVLAELHEVKNRIFFESVSDLMLQEFE